MLLFGVVPISKRPPRALSRAGQASIAGCGCGKTKIAAAVFLALGMMNAAQIHSLSYANPSDAAWRPHIAEENRIYFPALRLAASMRGGEAEVAELEPKLQSLMSDHIVYLEALDRGEPLPSNENAKCDVPHAIEAHAELEDALAERYADELFEIAKRRALSIDGVLFGGARISHRNHQGQQATIAGAFSSAVDFDKLAKDLDDTAAKDQAARKTRTDQANAQLDDWGKAVQSYTGVPTGSLTLEAKLALAVEGAIVRWAQGDWNSDAQKARALNSVKNALDMGIIPEPFDADEDFAKTYADKLDAEIDRIKSLEAPWSEVYADYTKALQSTAGDPRVASAVVETAGLYSLEFGPPFLCQAIAVATGTPNPSSTRELKPTDSPRYGLADLVAAVASVHMKIGFSKALQISYGALSKLIPVHPTICSGRGYKGDPDSWDYDMGPVLFVLQAWLDLAAEAKREHPFGSFVRGPMGIPTGTGAAVVVTKNGTSTAGSFVKGALVSTAALGVLAAIVMVGFSIKAVI